MSEREIQILIHQQPYGDAAKRISKEYRRQMREKMAYFLVGMVLTTTAWGAYIYFIVAVTNK